MYHILLEAAGLQQVRKLDPKLAGTFTAEIAQLLACYGFEPTLSSGDVQVYSGSPGTQPAPESIAAAVQSVHSALDAALEYLVGYTLIVDFYGKKFDEAHCQRLFRRTKPENAAWVSATAYPALENVCEYVAVGELYQIRSFITNRQMVAVPAAQHLVSQDLVAKIHAASREVRRVWVAAAAPAVAYYSARSACVDGAAVGIIELPFVADIDRLLMGIVRAAATLPVPAALSVRERRLHQHYCQRLSTTAADYLSCGLRSAELRVALRLILKILADHALIIRDAHRIRSDVWTTFNRLLDRHGADVLVIACGTPSENAGGWTVLEADAAVPADALSRYWWSAVHANEPNADELDIDSSPDSTTVVPLEVDIVALAALVRILPSTHQRMIAALWLSEGVATAELTDAILAGVGISSAQRASIAGDLGALGVLEGVPADRLDSWVAAHLGAALDPQVLEFVRFTAAEVVHRQVELAAVVPTAQIWWLAEPVPADRSDFRYRTLNALARGGDLPVLSILVDHWPARDVGDATSGAAARIRLALRDSQGPHTLSTEVALLRQTVYANQTPSSDTYHADKLLTLGEWYLAGRDYSAALSVAKRVVLTAQETDNPRTLAAAYLLMARVNLAQRRLSETGHYLRFAREVAERREPDVWLIACTLDAVRLFVVGNLSRATRALLDIEPELLRFGYTEWLLLAWFVHGRILFELGEYHQAHEHFNWIADFARTAELEAPRRVAGTWSIRALLHAGATPDLVLAQLEEELAEAGVQSAEWCLFAGEAQALAGRNDAAIELMSRAVELERAEDRWPRIGVCWDNGFAAVEDLVMANSAGNSELRRLAEAHLGWVLAQQGRDDEAVPIFYQLTRVNDGLSEDPYTGLYNFLYSSILPEVRNGVADDRVTILGKSVKFVQERTSRIDDYNDKIRFLQANSWNRRLMEQARRYNLV